MRASKKDEGGEEGQRWEELLENVSRVERLTWRNKGQHGLDDQEDCPELPRVAS